MAFLLETAARNAAVDAVTTLLNGGVLKICDATTVVFTFTFGATAFNAANVGVATNKALADSGVAIAGAAGVVDNFKAYKSDGTSLVLSGSVGESASDINLTNTDYNLGDTLTIDAADISYTQPASA